MDTIRIFFHRLNSKTDYEAEAKNLLPARILHRIQQYKPTFQVYRYASYLLLSKALHTLELPFDFNSLEITIGKKPKFNSTDAPHFSLSHSGEIVGVAICKKQPIGFDIEKHQKLSWDFLREKGFDPTQYAEAEYDFFEVWTRREATLKCLGLAISEENSSKLQYSLHEIQPETTKTTSTNVIIAEEYSAAVAFTSLPNDIYVMEIKNILSKFL